MTDNTNQKKLLRLIDRQELREERKRKRKSEKREIFIHKLYWISCSKCYAGKVGWNQSICMNEHNLAIMKSERRCNETNLWSSEIWANFYSTWTRSQGRSTAGDMATLPGPSSYSPKIPFRRLKVDFVCRIIAMFSNLSWITVEFRPPIWCPGWRFRFPHIKNNGIKIRYNVSWETIHNNAVNSSTA